MNFRFSAKRLRAHGLVLVVCLWSVYSWNVSTPGLLDRSGNLKGTDFLHFYTIGAVALGHQGAHLYDVNAQERIARERVPEAAGLAYLPLYPPQVSLLFAPLAKLSYSRALAIWLGLSALIYASCCFAVWSTCRNLHRENPASRRRSGGFAGLVAILALAFPAFWHLMLWGQTSAIALLFFTLAFLALRVSREFLAGVALGSLIFKPQLGLAAAILFLCTMRWRIVTGAVLSASAELLAGVWYYGFDPLCAWLRTMLAAPRELSWFEPRLYQTHCLRTFWKMLVPSAMISLPLYVICASAICVLLIACWRRGSSLSPMSLSMRYSALLFATVLIAPHLTVYDLTILAPAFLLLADWIVDHLEYANRVRLPALLYLAFVLPLIGPLARWTHFQLSVPVMAMALWMIWRSRNAGAVANSGGLELRRAE